ncbi:ERF family protein [Dinoroseobacter sp. S124A]|uniref:ERF family protein n=1 Tax=Dinoroseobacter sp. S124A TaxID=3415128 RepID=UPI003C7BCE60
MNAQSKELAPATEPMVPADPMFAMIHQVAVDGTASIEKLQQLLDLKATHDAQEAKKQFDRAFSQASADFPNVPQSGRNTHNNTTYSTLKDITSSVRPVLTRHGLALSFSTETGPEAVTVTAELSHEGGHVRRNSITLPLDTGAGRNRVQSVGSSQTYGQRYAAQAILGLSLGEDTEDDGRSTGQIEEHKRQKSLNWEQTIVSELPDEATPREKAKAIADAIVAQWGRMKGVRQIHNEWDRREHLISKLEETQQDLWQAVMDAYERRCGELGE